MYTSVASNIPSPPSGLYYTTAHTYDPAENHTGPSREDSAADRSSATLPLAIGVDVASVDRFSEKSEWHGDANPRLPSGLAPGDDNQSDSRSTQDGIAQNPSEDCLCTNCFMEASFIDLGRCPGSEKCKEICGDPGRRFHDSSGLFSRIYGCPFADCQLRTCVCLGGDGFRWRQHLQSHSGEPGRYHCTAKYCPLANKPFKRWAELSRHCEGAHCKNAKKYHCHVLGCKYHDHLSFVRKDKLTSHIRNVHAGYVAPGQGPRKLKPKVNKGEQSGTQA